MGQTSPKLTFDPISPNFQVQFAPKQQLPGFNPSRSQTSNSLLHKMIHYPYLVSIFLRKFNRPELSKFMCRYDVFFYFEPFFPKLPAAFLNQDVNRQFLSFEQF